MSDTHRHKQKRLIKTEVVERKQELGLGLGTSLPIEAFRDRPLIDAWHKFFSGSMRHGNKRKSVAKEKVRQRKRDRRSHYETN